MRLVYCQHHHGVADQLAVEHVSPATVAGGHRIAEIAHCPWKRVKRALDRHDRGKVGLAQGARFRQWLEYCAHRSPVFSATLSRTYSGAAWAASAPLPDANTGSASRNIARARGTA